MPEAVYLLQFCIDVGWSKCWSVLEVVSSPAAAAHYLKHGLSPATSNIERRVQIALLDQPGEVHDWTPAAGAV